MPDKRDRKVSERDAAVWTLIYKLIKAAQGDPFEASRRVAEVIAPVLEKAEKWDQLHPLVNDIATVSYRQVNGDRGPLTTAEIWNWQAIAERILYGYVGAYKGEVPDGH